MALSRLTLSHLCLRIGLGIVFLWIGIDIFRHPTAWIGFIPANLPFGVAQALALKATGAFDALLGVMLIIGLFPRLFAILAALHLVVILVSQGIDQVVIRDVGLLGASLALLFWPNGPRRTRGFLFWRRRYGVFG